ncbi:MAG: MBL fold metallo-hydrolase [Deferribacteraceae bacterium]|nr:MBL fold metallo-hydrolase [Deferribacteraceae bacterium]
MKKILVLSVLAIACISCATAQKESKEPAANVAYAAKAGDFGTFNVGNLKLTTLVDVSGVGDTSKLIGYTEEMSKKYTPDGKIGFYVNAFIVQTKDKNILVDTGFGAAANGQLIAAVANAGLTPDKIDIIVLTHMHTDHIGGLLTKDIKPAFPNATLMISKPEKDYWSGMVGMSEQVQMAKAVIRAYGAKVKTFNFGEKIIPEILTMDAVGHTAGHTAYLLNNELLIWGDIVHVAEVQMAQPGVSIAYDSDPVKAAETRIRIMNEVVKNKWSVAGMHLAFPAIGTLEKKGEGFIWVPKK